MPALPHLAARCIGGLPAPPRARAGGGTGGGVPVPGEGRGPARGGPPGGAAAGDLSCSRGRLHRQRQHCAGEATRGRRGPSRPDRWIGARGARGARPRGADRGHVPCQPPSGDGGWGGRGGLCRVRLVFSQLDKGQRAPGGTRTADLVANADGNPLRGDRRYHAGQLRSACRCGSRLPRRKRRRLARRRSRSGTRVRPAPATTASSMPSSCRKATAVGSNMPAATATC